MTKQFIISGFTPALYNNKVLFVADPYVYHVLERNNLITNFDSIEVASFTRNNKKDLIEDSNFVDEKYERYLPLLTQRLNQIHKSQYSESFWRKYLSLGFIRYLTAFHDTYKIITTHFDEQKFNCQILDFNSYFIPLDFEENRQCFLNSDFGQEQILSIYFNFKYPGKALTYRGAYGTKPSEKGISQTSNIVNKIKRIRYGHFIKIMKRIIVQLKYIKNRKNVVVGVIGSFFSDKNYAFLNNKSQNRIRNLFLPKIESPTSKLDLESRNYVSSWEAWFDDFDRFFFYSMKFCLPKICIEDYSSVKVICDNFINRHKKIKYIVSEAWLSDSYINILLAYLQNKGVRHIYNEHNCIFHPFEGNYLKHVLLLCDVYASVGWRDKTYINLIPTASLYEYSHQGKVIKKYKILYIGVPFLVKMQHYSSAWGFSGENVPKCIKFLDLFFSNVNQSTLNDISYRPYPPQNMMHILAYDKEFILKKYLADFKEITGTDESSKIQMRQSDLVIIDYISTSYLECLVMNIPFVFFWDKDSYYLKDEYTDFFTSLVNVGICQTDPVEAAVFIDNIKDNPTEWWFSESVQAGRQEFLNNNLGDPKVMLEYLMSLANYSESKH